MQVTICDDSESLARALAEHIVALGRRAIATGGRYALALAGGSTPLRAYALLASEPYREQLDWSRTHVFWGDERCVPAEHRESNYGAARQALLQHVPLAAQQVHRIPGELAPDEAAQVYERELRGYSASASLPRFDLLLLGMGRDGHTASLFSGASALQERERWVLAQRGPISGPWRVTLTPPVLNAAAQVTFVVAGRDKAAPLRQVLCGPFEPQRWPAQCVQPTAGEVLWLLDAEAAVLLEGAL